MANLVGYTLTSNTIFNYKYKPRFGQEIHRATLTARFVNDFLCTIVVFNVNESKMKTQQDRNDEDLTTVNKILENFDIDRKSIKVFRLGKFTPMKTRPIKVILPSKEKVMSVLKNKQLIKEAGIKIFADQTNQQREYYKKVQNELQNLIDSGDLIQMLYI
uniref:Uncharacterized protein LOC114346430 n=1 Tax=Diabrotica virgifera virgifera TaxID=50390 RepID=A0A6P7H5J1_DIAVI